MSSRGSDVKDLKRRMREVTRAAKGLPDQDVRNVEELVEVGELGIALENLCPQIYEHDLPSDPNALRMIRELGKELAVDERYWRLLETADSA